MSAETLHRVCASVGCTRCRLIAPQPLYPSYSVGWPSPTCAVSSKILKAGPILSLETESRGRLMTTRGLVLIGPGPTDEAVQVHRNVAADCHHRDMAWTRARVNFSPEVVNGNRVCFLVAAVHTNGVSANRFKL